MVIIGMLIVQCYIVIVPEILEINEYTVLYTQCQRFWRFTNILVMGLIGDRGFKLLFIFVHVFS